MFAEEKKNRERKEEKYLEKENIFVPRKRKTRKEDNNLFAEEKEIGVGKEELGKYFEKENVTIAGRQTNKER